MQQNWGYQATSRRHTDVHITVFVLFDFCTHSLFFIIPVPQSLQKHWSDYLQLVLGGKGLHALTHTKRPDGGGSIQGTWTKMYNWNRLRGGKGRSPRMSYVPHQAMPTSVIHSRGCCPKAFHLFNKYLLRVSAVYQILFQAFIVTIIVIIIIPKRKTSCRPIHGKKAFRSYKECKLINYSRGHFPF